MVTLEKYSSHTIYSSIILALEATLIEKSFSYLVKYVYIRSFAQVRRWKRLIDWGNPCHVKDRHFNFLSK